MRVSWDLKGKSDVPGRARDGGDGPGTPGSESGKRESQGREQRHSLTQSILGECPLCPRHCAGPGNQAVTSMDRKAELELRRRRQSIRDGESLPHFSDPKGSWRTMAAEGERKVHISRSLLFCSLPAAGGGGISRNIQIVMSVLGNLSSDLLYWVVMA